MNEIFACIICILLTACAALPTVVIDNPKPWCVSLDGPKDMIIRVEYEAPDLIVDQTDPNYSQTYLTVNVKPHNRVFDTDLHMAPIRERLKPLSQLLDDVSGFVTHQFEVDGTATICIRSSKASSSRPITFAFRVETSEQDPSIAIPRKLGKAAVDKHLTHMEQELQRITAAMNHVLKEADLNKNQDALFHEQTLAMHSATTFWPIVQVCVLLITGFTQASHIVRFFKSRRII